MSCNNFESSLERRNRHFRNETALKLEKVPLLSTNCDNDQLGFGSCKVFIKKVIMVIQDGDRGFRASYIRSISTSPLLFSTKFFNVIEIGWLVQIIPNEHDIIRFELVFEIQFEINEEPGIDQLDP